MVNIKITNQCISSWNERTSSNEFVLYRQIQEQFFGNPIWSYAKHISSMMYACFSVAQLIAYSSTFDTYCTRCDRHDIDLSVTEHILLNCNSLQCCRSAFERKIRHEFSNQVFDRLKSLSIITTQLIRALFGVNDYFEQVLHADYQKFYRTVIVYFHTVWNCYIYVR